MALKLKESGISSHVTDLEVGVVGKEPHALSMSEMAILLEEGLCCFLYKVTYWVLIQADRRDQSTGGRQSPHFKYIYHMIEKSH